MRFQFAHLLLTIFIIDDFLISVFESILFINKNLQEGLSHNKQERHTQCQK